MKDKITCSIQSNRLLQEIKQRDQQITLLRKQFEEKGKNSFNVNYYFKQSHTYYCAKKYEKSIEIVDGVLFEKPDHVRALNLKGVALLGINKMDLAQEYLNRGLKHRPRNTLIQIILQKTITKMNS